MHQVAISHLVYSVVNISFLFKYISWVMRDFCIDHCSMLSAIYIAVQAIYSHMGYIWPYGCWHSLYVFIAHVMVHVIISHDSYRIMNIHTGGNLPYILCYH